MDRATELGVVRRAYAKQIMAAARVDDRRIEAAFAAVLRENFLGPGPWPIFRWLQSYVPTPSADPVYLYTDDLVGIVPERHINNGQPSLHAALIASAAPHEGDHLVHVGAGVGYYTAIMAHLVGPSGRVTAIEFDAALAAAPKPISHRLQMFAWSRAMARPCRSIPPKSSMSMPARPGRRMPGSIGWRRAAGSYSR